MSVANHRGWAVSAGLVAAFCATAAAAQPPPFRISVQEPGVYKVTYEALVEAGLPRRSFPSGDLGLRHRKTAVPLWVADGGDGRFGPGDWLEFVGRRLAGRSSFFNEHTAFNVYWLSLADPSPERMATAVASQPTTAFRSFPRLLYKRHLEPERLMIRIPGAEVRESEPPALWFWAKLTHIDRQPLVVPLDTPGLDPDAQEPVTLRVQFRGLSRPRSKGPGMADHRVEVSLDGEPLGVAEWQGKTPYQLDLPPIPAARLAVGEPGLELRVPSRVPEGQENPLVDVVMLDWLEVTHPHRGAIEEGAEGQTRLHLSSAEAGSLVGLRVPAATDLVVYGDGGSRVQASGAGRSVGDSRAHYSFQLGVAETSFYAVVDGQLKEPARLAMDQASQLVAPSNRADYLMIAHGRLLQAVQPLAKFHRKRGLAVELIHVQDVYDEFGDGIVGPQALRDFISHAFHNWEKPAPRFVLLVGDASWDARSATVDDRNYANWPQKQLLDGPRFAAKESTPYTHQPQLNRRNLIPTWNFHSPDGHSASDNWFVSVDGDDFLPDLAIGRLPVTEPEEVAVIVRKTMRYAAKPELGPWRRNILWITNEQRGFQLQSDRMAKATAEHGFRGLKVYPRPQEPDNEHHQERLLAAFAEGQVLVHFIGHGGRYIWRTGPPDLRKNHDLFTLQHLAQLEPSRRLSVVLSMTCFSAPFDHPNADSIGEAFLRLEGRGAVAVLGASWRNTPTAKFSQSLVGELTRETTVGEAIVRAKRGIRNRVLVETYNLLGDPALPMAVPQLSVGLALSRDHGPRPVLRGEIDVPRFSGRALIEWLGGADEVVWSEERVLPKPHFEATFEGPQARLADLRGARVYAWDPDGGIDGMGRVDLSVADPAVETQEATAARKDRR